MTITAVGPDGVEHEFPDGTDKTVVRSVLAKKYGWDRQGSTGSGVKPAPEAPKENFVQDVARSIRGGIPFGSRIAALAKSVEPGGATYGENLASEQAKEADLARRHPVGNLAGNLAGALMTLPLTPARAVLTAPSMAARVAEGAKVGTGFGALQGVSDSPDITNVPRTVGGAAAEGAAGAVLGGAVPVVGRAIGATASIIADHLRPVEGMSGPAGRSLLRGVKASAPGEIDAGFSRLGPESMFADVSPSMRGKAQGVAGNSPEARQIIEQNLTGRNEKTNARLQGDVNAALGPEKSALAATQEIRNSRSDSHKPLAAIFKSASPVDISPIGENIKKNLSTAEGPEKAALSKVLGWLQEAAPKEASPGTREPVLAPNGNIIRYEIKGASEASPAKYESNPENLHNIKVSIDNLIKYGDPGLGIAPGALSKKQGALSNVRKAVNGILRSNVSGYANVMDRSSSLAKDAEALERGTGVLSNSIENHPALVAQEFSSMSPSSQKALKLGVRSDIEKRIGTTENDLSALRGITKDEADWNYKNLSNIFGDDKASRLSESVNRERRFRETLNKLVGNSETAARLSATKEESPSKIGSIAAVKDALLGPILARFKEDLPLSSQYYPEMAKILTAKGPERDHYRKILSDALMRQKTTSEKANRRGTAAALALALGVAHGGREVALPAFDRGRQ